MKKIVSMILLLSMIVCMIPAVSLTASAATNVSIGSYDDLVSKLSSANALSNAVYTLQGNIDCGGKTLNGTLYLKDGSTLNGAGYSITNFTTSSGIFNVAGSVTVQNLTLGTSGKPITLTADTSENVGAFVGATSAAISFESCHVYVSSSVGNARVGGYVGNYTGSSLSFDKCTANGSIVNTAALSTSQLVVYPAAGFVATVASSADLRFTNCVNHAAVTSGTVASGFVGYAGEDATVVSGKVTLSAAGITVNATFIACQNNGAITGASGAYVAGFFPAVYSMGKIAFDRCTNAGNLANATYIAGYVSLAELASVTISSSQNKGNISSTVNISHGGGFTGRVKTKLSVRDSVTTGTITGTSAGNAGQIASKVDVSASFTNCYALGDFSLTATNAGPIIGYASGTEIIAEGNKYVASSKYKTYSAVTKDTDAVQAADFDTIKKNILIAGDDGEDVVGAPAFRAVQETAIVGGKHTIRLIAAVDTCNYKTVGMTVTTKVNGEIKRRDTNLKCSTLYQGITAVSDKNGTTAVYMADDTLFAGKYLMALCLTNVPTTGGIVEIVVTPYAVAKDGTRYEGAESVVQYEYNSNGTSIANILINGVGISDDAWVNAFGTAIPAYTDGTMSERTYSNNLALGQGAADDSVYKMFMVSGTTSAKYEAYINTLKSSADCTVTDASDSISGVSGYWVETSISRMYTYMVTKTGMAYFILERAETQTTITEINDDVPASAGQITFYLYGLTYDDVGVNINEYYDADGTLGTATQPTSYSTAIASKPWITNGAYNPNFKNCGMLLVVKLADNSVMIIDGGHEAQMSDEAAVELNEFLHDITGKSLDQKVTIKAWYLTHYHGDHVNGFARFMNSFHASYEVERVMFNMSQFEYAGNIRTLLDTAHFRKWYPNLQFHRVHTGETIKLGGAEIDVLFTQEDLVYTLADETGTIQYSDNNDDNSASNLVRFRFDGISVMVTGDMAKDGQAQVMAMYETSALKADVFQAAHHTWNALPKLCAASAPSYILHAQSYGGTQYGLDGSAYNNYTNYLSCMNSSLNSTQKEANNYFGGGTTTYDETTGQVWQTTTATGISAVNGTISVNPVALDAKKPGFNAYTKGGVIYGDWDIWSEIDIPNHIIDKGWGDIFDFNVQ